MSEPDTVDLQAQIEALQKENQALRADPPDEVAPPRANGGSWWRAVLSALCIVIATILVPVSIAGAWARVQLVDEDAFVNTLAPLVNDPAVQNMIIEESMQAINSKVDFEQLTSNVFDGIAGLGLPPRAADALKLLEQPAASGLQSLVNSAVTKVVQSDAFAQVWATATRAAHRALVGAATSDGGGLVVRTDQGVGIQLGAIVQQVKQNLIDRGIGAAQIIPNVDKVIILGSGQNLQTIRTAYALATTLGYWLPIITLALFGLGILIARRRSTAILGTGIGFAVGAAALATGFAVGGTFVGMNAVSIGLSPDGLAVIYESLVANMRQTAMVLVFLGIFIAIVGWLMGRSRPARGFRRSFGSMNTLARQQLIARGLDTGAFGLWMGRQRILVRVIIAVLAVLWLYSMRPLSVGDILLVAVVSFAVGWILELLQRRPDELPALAAEPAEPYTDLPVESAGDGNGRGTTLEIPPADEAPTLDLTAETAGAATDAAATPDAPKGGSPTR
jgi:hypothetical protein